MNIYVPGIGSDISSSAKVLCRFIPCRMTFNDIELRSYTGSTPESIVADFWRQCDDRDRRYRESPEGQLAVQRQLADIDTAQRTVDALMVELDSVDLTVAADALEWLERYAGPADRIGVRTDPARIVTAFESAGWVRNDCVGHPEVASDSHIYARWLIGQALDGIAFLGAPHQVFHYFLARWRTLANQPQGVSQ